MQRRWMLTWLAAAALLATAPAGAAEAALEAWRDDLRPLPAEAWNAAAAAHLLERAGFGATPAEAAALVENPPERVVQRLVRWQQVENVPLPAFTESGVFPDDAFVPPLDGELERIIVRSIVTRRGLGVKLGWSFRGAWLQPLFDQYFYLLFANSLETARMASWEGDRMLRSARPLEEKLALFWHGHFATESQKVRDYRKMKAQWDLFRALGNGSFRELLLGVSRDPAMLVYLDGAKNERGHPNENYAREVLELFTMGPGPYTEADVQEAARAFTGWGLDGNQFQFRRRKHDRGKKTFLGVTGRLGGEDVVDRILEEPATARFVVARLYRFFVRPEISPAVEVQLARQLRESDYQIAPILETIFLSRDFYAPATRGAHVKSPVELIVSTYRKLGLQAAPDLPLLGQTTKNLGQGLFEPPNVAGWAGGRSWLSPFTLTGRQNFARSVLFPGETPPPERTLHEIIVSGVLGEGLYARLRTLAEEGRRGEPPVMDPEANGFARQGVDDSGLVSLPWSVWTGAERALDRMPFPDFAVARLDVAGLVRETGASDAAGAVDALASRFLSVPLTSDRGALLADYLARRMGSRSIDWARPETETDLRELLHLILSLPEYQVS